MKPRTLVLCMALLAAGVPAAAQQRPELEITLPAQAALGEEAPTIRARNVLAERYVVDLLRNGFPARLHFRAELWTTRGFFDSMLRSAEWDVLVRYDAMQEQFDAVRVIGDSATQMGRFRQFADLAAEIERPIKAPIRPMARRIPMYYNVTLELAMLSVSDLDEVERWLRGELKPAVRGQRNPGTAVGRGMRTLLAKVLGGQMRRLEARSETFRP
ncbi:MAG: hypothetical protein ABIZ91_11305 [Gemmatimonadaceae bacterium]